MQAEKIGERQVFIVAGIGLIIAQLILTYLGLGGRSLIKSFFWLVKNRYKLSLYLCILSVLACRVLYGQVVDINCSIQNYSLALFFALASFAWSMRSSFGGTRTFVPDRWMQKVLFPSICTGPVQPAMEYPVC